MLHGARPYLDIWDNKPPGIWWANALGFWICGEGGHDTAVDAEHVTESDIARGSSIASDAEADRIFDTDGVAGEVLICSVALAVALAAFVGAARRLYHKSITLPAAIAAVVVILHPQFEAGGNRTETFVIAAETTVVWMYLAWLRRSATAAFTPSVRQTFRPSLRIFAPLLLSGLAAGAAPMFKQSGIAAALACGAHLCWKTLRKSGRRSPNGATSRAPSARRLMPIALWIVGALILPAAAIGVLRAQGALTEARFAVCDFNRAYFDVGDATWTRLDRAAGYAMGNIRPMAGAAVVAAAGVAITFVMNRRNRGRQHPRPGLGLVLAWLLLASYFALAGPGRQGHHFLPMLPPLGLLSLALWNQMVARRGLRAELVARPALALIVALVLCAGGLLARAGLVEAQRCWQSKPHWYSLARRQPLDPQRQAAMVRRLSRPDETLFVWGWSPGTYRYAFRRCPARFATFEKLGQVGRHAWFIRDGAVADLKRNPPRVFVLDRASLGDRADPMNRWLVDWLSANYRAVSIDARAPGTRMELYVRRD